MHFTCITVVDAEYEARCAGDFLPTGAREPMPELSASDDDDAAEDDDDDPELPDLPIETAGASWSAAPPPPEKGRKVKPARIPIRRPGGR